MGSQLPIPSVIEIGNISVPLSLNYQSIGALFGATLQQSNPLQIAMATYALNEQYNGNPADSTLRGVANYVIFLSKGLQAQNIISGNGGGSVLPPPVYLAPNPISFVVADSGTPIVTGNGTLLLNGSAGNPDFRGYNIIFNRNNLSQSTTNNGGTYFMWNKNSGLFTVIGVASLGELFDIYPVL
jgi:hypothetical protein